MTDTPQVLLAHHLKTLKLPTFLREYDKLARQCATEGADHVRYLVRLTELELIDRERRMVERRIRQARFPAVKSLDSCQWRSKKGPPRRCKKGPLGGCGLVPVVHGRAPRATRRALNRLTRRRAREGPVGPRGQAWAGWSVQLAVGV